MSYCNYISCSWSECVWLTFISWLTVQDCSSHVKTAHCKSVLFYRFSHFSFIHFQNTVKFQKNNMQICKNTCNTGHRGTKILWYISLNCRKMFIFYGIFFTVYFNISLVVSQWRNKVIKLWKQSIAGVLRNVSKTYCYCIILNLIL